MALLGYSVPETLTDDAGNAMKGITVTVTGPSAYSGTAVSDATTGVLRLGPLPPGDYTVAYGSRSVTVPIVVSLPSGGTSGQVVTLSGSTPAWSDPASSGQPLDSDLTAIAALDSATAGALVTDGSGWIRKTYAQLKTALALTKGDVGLGNVDNTSDVSKPVSTATTAAVAAEATARDAAILAQANIAKGTYAPLDARDTSITSFTVGMLVSSGSSIYRVTTAHAAPFDSTKATQQGGTSLASGVASTPAGGLSSTDVQSALNELDTEKADAAATTTALGLKLAKASNLSDLASAATARTNLGAEAVGARAGIALSNYKASNMRRWRKMLGYSQGIGQASVLLMGDSITAGTGATSPEWANGWAAKFRQYLDDDPRYVANGTGAQSPASAGTASATPYTLGTGWSKITAGNNGFANNTLLSGTNPAGALGFNSGSYTGDTFVIYYLKQNTLGSLTPTVDGGAAGSAINTATGGTGSFVVASATVSAGSVGTHTLSLTATGTVYIIAIELYSASGTGVRIHNGGVGGSTIANWKVSPSTGGTTGILTVLNPDLVTVLLGTNGLTGSTTTQINTDLTDLLTVIQATVPNASIVLIAPPTTAGTASALNTAATRAPYTAVYQSVAAAFNVPLLDLFDVTGDQTPATQSPSLVAGDNVHPSQTGHNLLAQVIYQALVG